jgi:hypothetical protein
MLSLVGRGPFLPVPPFYMSHSGVFTFRPVARAIPVFCASDHLPG